MPRSCDVLDYEMFFKPGFLDWLSSNWHIYHEFEDHALRLIERGRTHYSARTIVEVLVHHSIIREVGGPYKIGNDRAPDLARVFAITHPGHERFWEYRRPDWPRFLAALGVVHDRTQNSSYNGPDDDDPPPDQPFTGFTP